MSTIYIVRGIKHSNDAYGKAYNNVWGTYYNYEEATKHAKMCTQTSYADEIKLETYCLNNVLSIGTGVPIEDRSAPTSGLEKI